MSDATIHGIQSDEFPDKVEQEPEEESDDEDARGGVGLELVHGPCKSWSQHGTNNTRFDKDALKVHCYMYSIF